MKNKLFADQIAAAKQDIKTRYLAGETVGSIASSYGISPRATYYHLDPLTPEDKALHTKNADLKRMLNKKNRKEEQSHGETISPESTAETTKPSLSDFDGE